MAKLKFTLRAKDPRGNWMPFGIHGFSKRPEVGEFLKFGINLYIINKVINRPNEEYGPSDGYLDLELDCTFKKIQKDARDLEGYVNEVIELMNLHLKSYDEKTRTLFDNTSSCNGYIATQRSFEYSLVLKLCCFYDEDSKSVSFPTLINECENISGLKVWLDGLANRKKASFKKAKAECSKLKNPKKGEREVLGNLFSIRNKHWGHIAKNRRSAKGLTYDDLDVVYKKTKQIMLNLIYAILDRDAKFSFNPQEKEYKKQATQFFNVLKAGQKAK